MQNECCESGDLNSQDCEIPFQVRKTLFSEFTFEEVFIQVLQVSSFVVVWQGLVRHRFPKECAERLPSFLHVPDEQSFRWHYRFYLFIVLLISFECNIIELRRITIIGCHYRQTKMNLLLKGIRTFLAKSSGVFEHRFLEMHSSSIRIPLWYLIAPTLVQNNRCPESHTLSNSQDSQIAAFLVSIFWG